MLRRLGQKAIRSNTRRISKGRGSAIAEAARSPRPPWAFKLEQLPEPRARIHKAESFPYIMSEIIVHVGLDVSKSFLDLHLGGQPLRLAHDPGGCAELLKRLAALDARPHV